MTETPHEPPGYAGRDDEPTTEQTGGGVEEVPRPDQGADPHEGADPQEDGEDDGEGPGAGQS